MLLVYILLPLLTMSAIPGERSIIREIGLSGMATIVTDKRVQQLEQKAQPREVLILIHITSQGSAKRGR